MAKKVFGMLNRRDYVYIGAPEFAATNDFLALVYSSPLPIDIYGINWGYIYGDAPDRALHLSGWMALVENYEVSLAQNPTGFPVLDPPNDAFNKSVIRLVDVMHETGVSFPGTKDRRFPTPITIEPGKVFSIIVNKPYTTANIAGTMVLTLSVEAYPNTLFNNNPIPRPWSAAGAKSQWRRK